MIEVPGIYDIDADAYHADPCPVPSLSSHVAFDLVHRSPAHAYAAHARLGGEPHEATKAMDLGAAIHSLLLGKGADIAILGFGSYRTKEAQSSKALAVKMGKIPLLESEHGRALAVAEQIRQQIADHADGWALFTKGAPERAMFWREHEAWCRGLVDWLPDDPTWPLVDLKTTELSAHPLDWTRRFVEGGPAFQEAFYLRGARALGRRPRGFLFVVAETKPPYAVSVLASEPQLAAHNAALVDRAIRQWRHCAASEHWPAYSARTAHISLGSFAQERGEDRLAMLPELPEPRRIAP